MAERVTIIFPGGDMITGIGSFPFLDIDEAIDLIFSTCREVPFWPQLPQRSPLENMYSTTLENIPSIVFDDAKGAVHVDTSRLEGVEQFYEDVAAGNLDAFAVTDRIAPGFYRFLERLKEIIDGVRYIKCQLTGPFSMGVGLKDENDRSIIYNEAFFDIIKKAIHMKALWMIDAVRKAYPGKEVIMFFDEPFMVSFGSAYIPVSKEDAMAAFNEVLSDIPAKRGVHVCGNTDWSVLLNAPFDIINYDAWGFMKTVFYYKEDMARFISRGGIMAPGIVPSSPEIAKVSEKDIRLLTDEFRAEMDKVFQGAGSREHLFTTSCGLGTLNGEEAKKAMELLSRLS